MVCTHLAEVEAALLAAGLKETSRGQAWSEHCREWVCFDAYLDTAAIRARHALADCVRDHSHRGTHDGQEHGLVCSACEDALMGHLAPRPGLPAYPPAPPA